MLAICTPRYDVQKAASADWQALRRVAAKVQPGLQHAFIGAVQALTSTLSLTELFDAMNSGDLAGLQIRHVPATLTPFAVTITQALAGGGHIAAQQLGPRLKVSLRFDATNDRATSYASSKAADLLTWVNDDTRQAVRDLITQGFTNQITPRETAKLIRAHIGLTPRYAQAVRHRFDDLLSSGLNRTQALAAAKLYSEKLLRHRALTIARHECLPGEALVSGAVVRAITRRSYRGPLVEIRTARCRQFSATPNHPVLTLRGWLPAAAITPDDDLVCDTRQQDVGALRHEDVERGPTTLREIFDTVATIGIIEREVTREPDFHGDGFEGEVDVLRPNRPLRVGSFAPIYQPLLNQLFTPADLVRRPSFCDTCSRLLSVDEQPCLCGCADLDVSYLEPSLDGLFGDAKRELQGQFAFAAHVPSGDLIGRQIRYFVEGATAALIKHAACLSPRSDRASVDNNIADPIQRAAHLTCDEQRAHAATIECDRVLTIGFRQFDGHVYNLWTPHGYFASNGVYTGNTLLASNKGQELLWEQAQTQGYLDPGTLRFWITTPDDRTCPICRPMNKRTTPISVAWATDRGEVMTPQQIHTQCRCAEALKIQTVRRGPALTALAPAPTPKLVEPPSTSGVILPPPRLPVSSRKETPWPLADDATRTRSFEDGNAIVAAIAQHQTAWVESLTIDEREAFVGYSGAAYRDVNRYLRRGVTALDPTDRDWAPREARRIVAAMKQAPNMPEPLLVWRGITSNGAKQIAAIEAATKGDGFVTLAGLQSTSIRPGFAAEWATRREKTGVVLEILTKRGVLLGSRMSNHSHEVEFLLPHNATYRIRAIKTVPFRNGTQKIIQLELVED